MVLGVIVRAPICALVGVLLVPGCSGERTAIAVAETGSLAQTPVTGEATVLGFRIQLIGSDPCRLRYSLGEKANEVPLLIPPPCTFHRERDGTVRVPQVKG